MERFGARNEIPSSVSVILSLGQLEPSDRSPCSSLSAPLSSPSSSTPLFSPSPSPIPVSQLPSSIEAQASNTTADESRSIAEDAVEIDSSHGILDRCQSPACNKILPSNRKMCCSLECYQKVLERKKQERRCQNLDCTNTTLTSRMKYCSRKCYRRITARKGRQGRLCSNSTCEKILLPSQDKFCSKNCRYPPKQPCRDCGKPGTSGRCRSCIRKCASRRKGKRYCQGKLCSIQLNREQQTYCSKSCKRSVTCSDCNEHDRCSEHTVSSQPACRRCQGRCDGEFPCSRCAEGGFRCVREVQGHLEEFESDETRWTRIILRYEKNETCLLCQEASKYVRGGTCLCDGKPCGRCCETGKNTCTFLIGDRVLETWGTDAFALKGSRWGKASGRS